MARRSSVQSSGWVTGRLLGLLAAISLSACVSASLEDAAPTQPPDQEQAAPVDGPGTADAGPDEARDTQFVEQGALRNREFPTFANTPVGATEQLSPEDKRRIENEMASIRAAYGSGALSEAAYNARVKELSTLARTHGSDARDEIEN